MVQEAQEGEKEIPPFRPCLSVFANFIPDSGLTKWLHSQVPPQPPAKEKAQKQTCFPWCSGPIRTCLPHLHLSTPLASFSQGLCSQQTSSTHHLFPSPPLSFLSSLSYSEIPLSLFFNSFQKQNNKSITEKKTLPSFGSCLPA